MSKNDQQTLAKGSEANKLPAGREARLEFRSGPLPPPSDLAAYEKVHPGLADRLTTMAEKQAKHRRGMEKGVLFVDGWHVIAGQVFGFTIVVLGFWAGVYLIINDKPISGFISMLTPLAVIVGTFLYTKKKAAW